jgi:serine/threonine protein kinase
LFFTRFVCSICFFFFFSLSRPVFAKVSAEAKDLLAGMLCVDPTKRLSASECLLHPWISGKCHDSRHAIPLNEVQEHMMARIERRRRKG